MKIRIMILIQIMLIIITISWLSSSPQFDQSNPIEDAEKALRRLSTHFLNHPFIIIIIITIIIVIISIVSSSSPVNG